MLLNFPFILPEFCLESFDWVNVQYFIPAICAVKVFTVKVLSFVSNLKLKSSIMCEISQGIKRLNDMFSRLKASCFTTELIKTGLNEI